jgi:hypothetical protein
MCTELFQKSENCTEEYEERDRNYRFQNSFSSSKASDVKKLKTYQFNMILLGEFKKITGGLLPNIDISNPITLFANLMSSRSSFNHRCK